MTFARHCSIDLESTPYYHMVSRCVRRSFLCGEDPVTGKNFDHRKQWLVDRIKTLGEIFSMDVVSGVRPYNLHFCEMQGLTLSTVAILSSHEIIGTVCS